MLKIIAFFPRLRAWAPSILIMAAIFTFSSIPSNEMPNFGLLDFLVKKGGHAVGYALLALANLRALQRNQDEQKVRAYILAWVVAVLYSATDEFHQSFVPGRHMALADVGIDSLGAVAGLWFGVLFQSEKQKSD